MFQIEGSSVVIFSKFFSEIDATTVLAAIPDDANKVLFVDTGATPDLVKLIKALHEKELTVFVRDHHKGEGRNPESAEAIQRILGDRAKIVDRKSAPGCAQLVETGEFADADVIVADPDYDGLVAAMKAQGVSYEGMDDDAVAPSNRRKH